MPSRKMLEIENLDWDLQWNLKQNLYLNFYLNLDWNDLY